MNRTILALAFASLTANLFAIQGTLVTDSEELKGDIRWDADKREYVVTVKKGNAVVDMRRPLADVTSLDIPRPAALDKAVKLVESGQGASAISILNKLANEYHMMHWDRIALRALVQAHLAAGNAQRAYETCRPLIASDAAVTYTGKLAPVFWQVLRQLGKRNELEKLLNLAVKLGDRPSSAAAQNLRGDLILAEAKGSEDVRRALTDGYLRVVLLYQDADCAEERHEALLKAAECYEKLDMKGRAEEFRKQAKATGANADSKRR